MARTARQPQIFTVRCNGDRIGTYRALTAEAAIARAKDDQAGYGSVFRGQGINLTGLTAAVEDKPEWMKE